MIAPDLPAMSRPTSSSSVIGPTGNPKSSIARSIASIATPSSSMRPASLMYGARIRLTKNPGASFTTITVLPSRRPNATAVAITSGAVRGVTITSSSGIFCTGEKKCMPITRSGRGDPSAICAIGIVLVLLAKIADGGSTRSTSASTWCFTARSSNTASITSGTLPKPV